MDFANKRVLIFVVAYNAEKTIESVLDRIPEELRRSEVEVLIIDDSSKDATFQTGLKREDRSGDFKVTILRTPVNQGYGGNQKLGYRYAIDHGFDVVALLHGDGQYAPEKLPILLEPFLRENADAVFGSRMINKGDALKGGMPRYKWVGNQCSPPFRTPCSGRS
jgi:glycosyltransferase involved in cell wall biosynthesis